MAKSEHTYHGDPRHHTDELIAAKVKIRQLEEENKELREELVRMTTIPREQTLDWRSVGW